MKTTMHRTVSAMLATTALLVGISRPADAQTAETIRENLPVVTVPVVPAPPKRLPVFGAMVDVGLPDVEITQHGLKMAGVPGAAQVGDVSVTSSFTLSSSTTAWTKRLNCEVYVHQVKVAANGSLADLGFIEIARVTGNDPVRPEGVTELLNYARTEGTPPSSDIEVSMPTPIDITTLWSADQAVIELQVAGQLPEQDWTVDVTLSLSGKIACQL
jgi:hypothetical protein